MFNERKKGTVKRCGLIEARVSAITLLISRQNISFCVAYPVVWSSRPVSVFKCDASCRAFAIDGMIQVRKTNGIANVSCHRYETLQKLTAITTNLKVLGLGCGNRGGFLDQNPCPVNGNVFAHKEATAFP